MFSLYYKFSYNTVYQQYTQLVDNEVMTQLKLLRMKTILTRSLYDTVYSRRNRIFNILSANLTLSLLGFG